MSELHRFKEEFLKHLDGFRGYSPLTVQSYADTIEELLRSVEIAQEGEKVSINLMPFRLRNASHKPKTISRKLSAVRSFVAYLRTQGLEVSLRADESVKVPKSLPKPISHEHILQVLAHAEPMARLAITILYTMGLRISELSDMKLSDIGPQWCRVSGKGNRQRDVPVLDHVYAAMQTYHKTDPSKEYVFEAGGEKLSENSLRYTITKAFAQNGLKVTPHQLRHAYATELLNNRARIADVSQLLGHASMATTQIYTKLGNALKMDHYRQSHPLCRNCEDS